MSLTTNRLVLVSRGRFVQDQLGLASDMILALTDMVNTYSEASWSFTRMEF